MTRGLLISRHSVERVQKNNVRWHA